MSIETSNELSFYCLRTFFCCKMERSIAFLRILMQHDAIVSLKHNKFLDVFKHVDVSENSGIHFNRAFHYKPSILGYPYFWKPPCIVLFHLGSYLKDVDGCHDYYTLKLQHRTVMRRKVSSSIHVCPKQINQMIHRNIQNCNTGTVINHYFI